MSVKIKFFCLLFSEYSPNPYNSPYSTGISPNRVPLWTSGYEGGDTSIFNKSPLNRSPLNRSR